MFEAFLVTTSSEGLSALGMREHRSFELVSETVRDHLGEAHAALFAEPVATDHGDRYDWYAAIRGKARRLVDLEPGLQAEMRERLERLIGDVSALAERLGASGKAEDLRLAEALKNAVRVPGDGYVYVVDPGEGAALQPVLVNWAWVGDEQLAVRGVLAGEAKPEPPKAGGPQSPQAVTPAGPAAAPIEARADHRAAWRGIRLLGWVALGVMLASILALLIAPCGLRGPAWLSFCPAPAQAAAAGPARSEELEDMIAQLERRIGLADNACQPAPPPAPAVDAPPPVLPDIPAPQPSAPDEFQDRLNRAGAASGDLSISLAWDNSADLDLSVICPSGAEISFAVKVNCNGQLDVDSNENAAVLRRDPIENVYYEAPLAGRYTIRVTLYRSNGEQTPVDFRMQLRDGDEVIAAEGSVGDAQPVWSMTYDYVGSR